MARRALDGNPKITSRHGGYTPYGFYNKHLGYDYGVAIGHSVKAPESGKITAVGNSGANSVGLYVYLDGKYSHRFLHLSKQTVKVGQTVKEGQEIGKTGNTGFTTGPHLHHDTRRKGSAWNASFANYIDWEAYIKPAPAPVKKSNETIAREVIAGKWGNGPSRVLALTRAGYNPVTIQNLVNQMLKVPSKPVSYRVVKGDTLSSIGKKTGVAWTTIAKLNGIRSPYTIYPGQVLRIRS